MSYTVTIVGGTGGLGHFVTEAFLTEIRPSFPHVRVLTRDPSSDKAQALLRKGAELYKLDDTHVDQSLDAAFAGSDVVINVLSFASTKLKRAVIQAVARNDAKVYFLPEYGCDHRLNDFPGYEHPEWTLKRELAAETRSAAKATKVIALYTSIFLDLAFTGPYTIFDITSNTYTCYGSPAQRVTCTSMADIARAIARLSVLALDPETAATVPDELRIAGSTVSYEDVRDIVARVKGVENGQIISKDLGELKESLRTNPGKERFMEYVQVIYGEGKADFSVKNDNGVVNPGESLWKWQSVEDFVRVL